MGSEIARSSLWGFLAAWRALFDRFDEDKSGHISFEEYSKALVAFGYRLSPSFVDLLYSTYDKSGHGHMSFDLFVQSCIILKRMTDVFKKYDDDRDGYITLSFEEFLTGMYLNCAFVPGAGALFQGKMLTTVPKRYYGNGKITSRKPLGTPASAR